eukprot:gene9697-9856_t
MEALEDDMLHQMQSGLERANSSTILMLPTYVLKLPTGHETGSCYAIDIGGTNFRVVHYVLSDRPGVIEKQVMRQVAIPKEAYTGTCNQLFDFLAIQLADFIKEQECGEDAALSGASSNHHPTDGRAEAAKLPVVGFCFSFAVEQTALNCGKLMGWTKGFDVEGVIGKDVVQLLSDALVRVGQPCRVLALINDSVGVLTASCYFDNATEMGVILGTGTNACIVERVSAMPKWRPKGVSPDTRTAINTEWGCYCSSLLPRCKEDLELDAASGPQQGETGMLRDMAAVLLGLSGEEACRKGLDMFTGIMRADLFDGDVPIRLTEKDGFQTADLSEIESDRSPLRTRVSYVLINTLGVKPGCLNIETLYMGWMDRPRRLVVAVDGGVYLKYNNWRTFLDECLREAFGPRAQDLAPLLQFKPVADGSSFGAAVLAAAAANT